MVFPKLLSGALAKKAVSLLVVASFIFSNIALVDASSVSTSNADKKEVQITTDPEKIVIPRDYGIVKAKYTAKDSRKLVVHIQDAHCNYEAQSNIIKILECLIKNDGLGLISVEGADGFIDTSWFKAFPDADIRKEVADYFMKKGEITGPEFLSITSDYPIKLFGAETRAYYIENLNAFTSSYPLKEDTEKYFNQIKAVINKLKDNIYSPELKEMDEKSQDYESKKLSFTDYVKFLEALAGRHSVALRQYENLFKLVSVLIYEKKINFSVVDKERAALIDAITKKLDKDQLKELVNKSLEFKVSKISSAEYYDYLKALALKYGIALVEEYPNLFNYIIYNSVYSRIENEKLFNDIKRFEEAVKDKIFANEDQRTLDKLSRHINILLGLTNIKLLNGDFDYYKEHKEEFSHEAFASFINKMAAKFGFAYEIDAPSEAVVESMPKLEDFYAIAIKRDKALVDNTMEAMKKENAQISVLVTGGFHSEGITKLLEKQGVSYIVICPNITKDVETPYIKILTNQRTPLEEILSDTGAAATTDASNVKGNMLAPILISRFATLNEKQIRSILSDAGISAEESDKIIERIADLKNGWKKRGVAAWLRRALIIAQNNKYAQDVNIMRNAFIYAMQNGLIEAKLEQKKNAIKDEEEKKKAHLTDSEINELRDYASRIANSSEFISGFEDIYNRLAKPLSAVQLQSVEAHRNTGLVTDILTDYQLELMRRAAYAFGLGSADEEYLTQMWAQHLMRKGKKESRQPLKIITDKSKFQINEDEPIIKAVYKPEDGNFILASELNALQREKILGASEYDIVARDGTNKEALLDKNGKKRVVVTLNSLDGGIGENVDRLEFLKEKAKREGVPEDRIKKIVRGAKGTDLGFYLPSKNNPNGIFVSIAEVKLMQLAFIGASDKYAGIQFQPIVNYQSKKSYDDLLNKTIYSADGMDKRTYRGLLEDNHVKIIDSFEQLDLPAIGVNNGNISYNTKNPHQPGGHGQLGFSFLYNVYKGDPLEPKDENMHIRVFYNGDNANSRVDENIAGLMAKENIPIIKLTTVATPIDKKGGKDGVRVIVSSNGDVLYVPDQMEERDAKNAGQSKEFYAAGMANGSGKAEPQPFNTNIFYINTKLLHSILNELVDEDIITKEKLYEIISPILIDKDAKKGIDGQDYVPIDGAIGTAIHNLNAFYVTCTAPKMKDIRDRYGKRLLSFVDVPRTQFFTPVKKTYDIWMQGWSDYYVRPNPAANEWVLADATKNNPPEFDLEYLVDKKETYWHELQNLINSFGTASTKQLKSLKIRGKVLLRDAKLIGDITIVNNSDKLVDLSGNARLQEDGKFTLKNVSIVIDKHGVVESITDLNSDHKGQEVASKIDVPALDTPLASEVESVVSFPISDTVKRIVDEAVKKSAVPISPELVQKIGIELTALDNTIKTIGIANIGRKPIIIAHDTGLVPKEGLDSSRLMAQAAEAYLEEYYGGNFLIARGEGEKLAEKISEARGKLPNAVVVTIAGDETLKAIETYVRKSGLKDRNELTGTILNIQLNNDEPYIPFAVLYSLAFKIAYDQIDEDATSLLRTFFVLSDPITSSEQLKDILKKGILRMLPKAGRVNPAEAREAYLAAAAALRSL